MMRISRIDNGAKLLAGERLYDVEGVLLRVRVTRQDVAPEIGDFAVWQVQIAPAADATGDVMRAPDGSNQLFEPVTHTLRADVPVSTREWADAIIREDLEHAYRRYQLMRDAIHMDPFGEAGASPID